MPPKTHCIRNHQFTERNTYYRKDGSRNCRECHRIEKNASTRARKLEEKREMGLIYQTLGSKEMGVWTHVAQGLSNKQIGRELGMTEGNVEWWVSQLLLRFEVQNRVQLAKMHWSNKQVNIRGL